ncbi:hypothetical protein ACHAPQ_011308, partial [Fusarium lateritium]
APNIHLDEDRHLKLFSLAQTPHSSTQYKNHFRWNHRQTRVLQQPASILQQFLFHL